MQTLTKCVFASHFGLSQPTWLLPLRYTVNMCFTLCSLVFDILYLQYTRKFILRYTITKLVYEPTRQTALESPTFLDAASRSKPYLHFFVIFISSWE